MVGIATVVVDPITDTVVDPALVVPASVEAAGAEVV